MAIDCHAKKRDQIETEILDAMIRIVERHKGMLGGGITLVECSDEDSLSE
jgi:hypothetical protein